PNLVGRADEGRLAEELALLLFAKLRGRGHRLPFHVAGDVTRGNRPIVVVLEHVMETVRDVVPCLLVSVGAVAGDELEDVEIRRFTTVALERREVFEAMMPDPDRGEMEAETGGAIDRLVGARAHPDWKILLYGRRHDLNPVQMVVLALVAEFFS